ncbi:hypothetical protein RUMHYD_03210 [Blautia hydrogenotrophica DSM 10507]|uniref:Uncharacterized protein n=1 Tax=Blautia hydrogenotrophica (strain DSM 10507 / JCM 14656 / S5a33) TaxID=476272 RepID=C0CQP7_BLAHS|nr:hypothetical protein RUMHYD_03210 [Blautia hydrogenotrophica DSM 10507]
MLMHESSLLLHKRSAKEAHAAMGNFTVKKCCGGAQSGTRPSKLGGKGELK